MTFTREELSKRQWSGKPCVTFNIGDHDQLAWDFVRGSWFYRKPDNAEIYYGPHTKKETALRAWQRETKASETFGRVQEWTGSYKRNGKPRVYEQIGVPVTSFVTRDEAPRPSWHVRLWRWLTDWW